MSNTQVPPTKTSIVVPAKLTPFPTLTNDEATQQIRKIAFTDEPCGFPCWGGIIPGTTYWYQVNSYLASFAKISEHSPSLPGGYDVYVPMPKQSPSDTLWVSFYINNDELVRYITGWRYNLTINQLFQNYGKPDQVFLKIVGVLPSDAMEMYSLIISYEKKGFFLLYSGETKNQPNLNICPENIKDPSFWLWDPKDSEAMNTIVNGRSNYRFPDEWDRYQEIVKGTKGAVTPDWLYQTYSQTKNSTKCFQIQSPNWEAPK